MDGTYKPLPKNSVNPEGNYFHKFEDHISLKNVEFEFSNLILSLKTMINKYFLFLNPPVPPPPP